MKWEMHKIINPNLVKLEEMTEKLLIFFKKLPLIFLMYIP